MKTTVKLTLEALTKALSQHQQLLTSIINAAPKSSAALTFLRRVRDVHLAPALEFATRAGSGEPTAGELADATQLALAYLDDTDEIAILGVNTDSLHTSDFRALLAARIDLSNLLDDIRTVGLAPELQPPSASITTSPDFLAYLSQQEKAIGVLESSGAALPDEQLLREIMQGITTTIAKQLVLQPSGVDLIEADNTAASLDLATQKFVDRLSALVSERDLINPGIL